MISLAAKELKSIEHKLEKLGCPDNNCLVKVNPLSAITSKAICQCWINRTDLDLHSIFVLKGRQITLIRQQMKKIKRIHSELQDVTADLGNNIE